MSWHGRYLHQAEWTRQLRLYLLQRSGWDHAHRVLEVGCGTGAVLSSMPSGSAQVHGLDVDRASLAELRLHARSAHLTRGDALALPYKRGAFNITFCHFLLMWVTDPLMALQEMKRVTTDRGYVIAFAEPDYEAREDRPASLAWLGARQNDALRRRGAALSLGAELASLFQRAGISIREAGTIRRSESGTLTSEDWVSEWETLKADLEGEVPIAELNRLQRLDQDAMLTERRVLHVPTYFVWGQV
ncbi:MAG TPA: class I SAM-dependent methyltransferase [Anaerolineales bacterium]